MVLFGLLFYDYITKSHDITVLGSLYNVVLWTKILEPWIMSAFHTNPIIEKQANIGAVFGATVAPFRPSRDHDFTQNHLLPLAGWKRLTNSPHKTPYSCLNSS